MYNSKAFVRKEVSQKVLYEKVRDGVREIISVLCKCKNVEIIAGAVCIEHVHLSVAIPPKLSISNFMGYLKEKSTLMIYDRHPELQSKWEKAFWARGYYVETIGNIIDEAVQKYKMDMVCKIYNFKGLQMNFIYKLIRFRLRKKKTMEKELSMGKALVETYNYEAYPLAIMASRGDEYLVWLLNNYIQLNCHEKIGEDGDLFLAFYDDQGFKSPYLKTQLISHEALKKLKIDMKKFIKKNINEGYYLHFQVDEYYISHRYYYQKMHLIHDLLICGYTKEDELIVWGYDEKAKFTKTKLAFSRFEEGFLANDLDKDKNDWADKIRLMKYKSNVKYQFNLELLIGLLEDYVNSKNRFEKYSRYRNGLENTCYGLEIYQKVLDYIDSFDKRKFEYFDNRIFKIIMEHKYIMQKRLEYLQKYIDCKDLQEEYKQVMEKANNCHLLAIMFNMKHKKEVLEQIKLNIRFIRDEDKRIIQRLIEKIMRITCREG